MGCITLHYVTKRNAVTMYCESSLAINKRSSIQVALNVHARNTRIYIQDVL